METSKTSLQGVRSADVMIQELMDVKNLAVSSTNMMSKRHRKPSFVIHVECRQVKRDRQIYNSDASQTNKRSSGGTATGRRRRIVGEARKTKDTAGRFSGAPFSTQTHRFQVDGLHPGLLHGVPPTSTLSPCSYKPFAKMAADTDKLRYSYYWKSDGYQRGVLLTERQKEKKVAEQLTEDSRGPALYSLPPIVDRQSFNKSGTTFAKSGRFGGDEGLGKRKRGVIQRNAPATLLTTPGPGSYLLKLPPIGGAVKSMRTTFESALGHKPLSCTTDSGLAPSRYVTDHLDLAKQSQSRRISKRGPYQTFTTSRWDRLCFGAPGFRGAQLTTHQRNEDIGPGSYSPKYPDKGTKESFRKVTKEQTGKAKTQAASESLSSLHKKDDSPGPGSYEAPELIRSCAEDDRIKLHASGKVKGISAMIQDEVKQYFIQAFPALSRARAGIWYDKYGFLSTTKKRDKMTYDAWHYGYNYSVGPGRYDVHRFDRKMQNQANTSGHKSVFKSKLPQHSDPATGSESPCDVMRRRNVTILQRKKANLEKMVAQAQRARKSRLAAGKKTAPNTRKQEG